MLLLRCYLITSKMRLDLVPQPLLYCNRTSIYVIIELPLSGQPLLSFYLIFLIFSLPSIPFSLYSVSRFLLYFCSNSSFLYYCEVVHCYIRVLPICLWPTSMILFCVRSLVDFKNHYHKIVIYCWLLFDFWHVLVIIISKIYLYILETPSLY